MSRIAILLLITFMSLPAKESKLLQEHRWKHRLVIAHVVPDDADAVVNLWSGQGEGVKDRDLILIDVSAQAIEGEGLVRPGKGELEAIRKFAGINTDGPSTFVLVGKDGGTKASQTNQLELKKFFALIDTMPMRRREMRDKN